MKYTFNCGCEIKGFLLCDSSFSTKEKGFSLTLKSQKVNMDVEGSPDNSPCFWPIDQNLKISESLNGSKLSLFSNIPSLHSRQAGPVQNGNCVHRGKERRNHLRHEQRNEAD